MKKSILLPIEKNPPIQAYHYRAFPLCIAMAQGEHVLPWVYNQYVNIIHNPRLPHDFEVYMYDWWFTKAGVFTVNTLRLEPHVMDCSSLDLVNLVKEMLEKGYYIFGAYDEYFIPEQLAYRVANHRHDYLIYGYNDEQDIFNTIGYTKKGLFIPHTIPQEAYFNALRYLKDSRIEMHCVKINPEYKFAFDLKKFCQDLYDYLHSTDSHSTVIPDISFGLAAEEIFVQQFHQYFDASHLIDLRYAKTFLEHKNLMYLRANFLLEQGFLQDITTVDQCKKGLKDMGIVFNLCMKYNMTLEPQIIQKIIEKMEMIIKDEAVSLNNLYDQIKKK